MDSDGVSYHHFRGILRTQCTGYRVESERNAFEQCLPIERSMKNQLLLWVLN